MSKGAFAAAIFWLMLAAPTAAHDPLAKLPPAPRYLGASGELATQLLAAHERERVAVGSPPLDWDGKPVFAAAAPAMR